MNNGPLRHSRLNPQATDHYAITLKMCRNYLEHALSTPTHIVRRESSRQLANTRDTGKAVLG
jgi:hypothetical protein